MADPEIERREKEVVNHINLLENWWKKIDNDENGDNHVAAQLIGTHYFVVAAYGIIESEMKKMLSNYVREHCPDNFIDIINNSISSRYSWDYEKIKKTLAEFNQEWKDKANNKLSDEQKNSISSLKGTRDKIAHGVSNQATFEDTKKQFKSSIKALHIISDIITAESNN